MGGAPEEILGIVRGGIEDGIRGLGLCTSEGRMEREKEGEDDEAVSGFILEDERGFYALVRPVASA